MSVAAANATTASLTQHRHLSTRFLKHKTIENEIHE